MNFLALKCVSMELTNWHGSINREWEDKIKAFRRNVVKPKAQMSLESNKGRLPRYMLFPLRNLGTPRLYSTRLQSLEKNS